MQQVVKPGKFTYVAPSTLAAGHTAQPNEAAKSRNFRGWVGEQSRYTFICRTPELEVIPACKHYGVGLIPWGPLMGGALAGGAARARSNRRGDANAQGDLKKNLPKVLAYEAFCKKKKCDPAKVCLAWLLANPAMTAPIIGLRA